MDPNCTVLVSTLPTDGQLTVPPVTGPGDGDEPPDGDGDEPPDGDGDAPPAGLNGAQPV